MKNRIIYHLSHIDLDGYSCQLVMNATPYTKHNFNANYGPEVKSKLNIILDGIKKEQEPTLLLVTDLNLTDDESRWLSHEIEKLNKKLRSDQQGMVETYISELNYEIVSYIQISDGKVKNIR